MLSGSTDIETEEKLRKLYQRYTGLWGAKVFWLATLTLLPLVSQLKIFGAVADPGNAYVQISYSTILYIVYHCLGILCYFNVLQHRRNPSLYSPAESFALARKCWMMDRIIRPIAPLVIVCVVLTFGAYVQFVGGANSYTIQYPRIVYSFLGLVPPELPFESVGETVPLPAMTSEPKWLTTAMNEIGVSEDPGSVENPRILEYLRTTTLPETLLSDQTPWSSGFVNWVLAQNDIQGTGSARTSTWSDWGVESKLVPGCIVVLTRSGPLKHVGFLVGEAQDSLLVLGGNQKDQVGVNMFDSKYLETCRMPGTDEIGKV